MVERLQGGSQKKHQTFLTSDDIKGSQFQGVKRSMINDEGEKEEFESKLKERFDGEDVVRKRESQQVRLKLIKDQMRSGIHETKISFKGNDADLAIRPSFWPPPIERKGTIREHMATVRDKQAKTKKKQAALELSDQVILERRLRHETETIFHYETKLPENGLFDHKGDKNLMQDILT